MSGCLSSITIFLRNAVARTVANAGRFASGGALCVSKGNGLGLMAYLIAQRMLPHRTRRNFSVLM